MIFLSLASTSISSQNNNEFSYRKLKKSNSDRMKSASSSQSMQSKKELLEVQKQIWENEIAAKAEIYNLIKESLILDIEIKTHQLAKILQKLAQ